MADQPSPRRRFQFRLRTLMIVVMLFCVACAYVRWQAKIVEGRRAAVEKLYLLGGFVLPADQYRREVSLGWRRPLVSASITQT